MNFTHSLTPEILSLFETVPDLYLILSPDLHILTASNPYLEATFTRREQIAGKYVFDVFPDNPDAPQAQGVSNLEASFRKVLSSRKPHQMAIQHYDVPHPTEKGTFIERYWAPLNTPVLDPSGKVNYIIHKVVNVTDLVEAQRKSKQDQIQIQGLSEQLMALTYDLMAARAQTELERAQLYNILMQAPAMICIFEGPNHVFKLVNPPYQKLVGERPLLGKPIAEAMPELQGQRIFELLDKVYRTGERFHAQEMKVPLDHHNIGELGENYYNFTYQAMRNRMGEVEGILVFAYQVTEEVKSRQLVEESEKALQETNAELAAANEEILASNEELRASSEEIQAANEQLLDTQKQLQTLNLEMEARVWERTGELQVALREIEGHREQLLGQQGLLEAILGQVPASIATLAGREHRYSYFNSSYQILSGNRAGLDLTVAQVFPEVIEQGIITLLDQVYATGKPFMGTDTPTMLYDPTTGKPEQRYIDFIYQPLFNEQHQTQGILIFIVDVTEKVEVRQRVEALQKELLVATQQQLAERETFFQLFEQTLAAVCIQRGPSHHYTFVNPVYQNLFPDREFIGRPIAEVLPETLPQGFVDLLDKVYQTGETFFGKELPVTLSHADGSASHTIYFDFTYQAYRENGQIVGIYTFAFDVTEQVLARRKIEESEERFRNLADNMTPLAWMADPEGWIYWYNKRWYEYTGTDFEEMQGWGWEKVHHPEYIDGIVEFVKQAWKKNQTWELEFPLRKVDGTYGWFLTRAVPIVDAQDKIIRWLGTNTDISGQKRVQQQLQTVNEELASTTKELRAANEEILSANEELSIANDQLLRTNVDLDNFIYTASHDLKAPISNIEGLMHTLLRTLPAESLASGRVERITTLMGESIERFKRTIDSLTEVVKLQKENNREAIQVDLLKTIEEVSLDLASQVEEAKARLEVEVAGCFSVRFSEKNLRSLIYNLLSNALKYRSPDRAPVVSLHCESSPEYAVLSVSDNGLGIASERMGQLFTMFKRFHNHVEGSGIGLYMVKKMVENAGGKIEAESELGKGSTFRVYFPR